jgi:hypothetical protein
MDRHSKSVHLGKKDFRCDDCDKAFGFQSSLIRHISSTHKCANLPETHRSADQNDQKIFVQVNVTEEILETKEIKIKEELDDDVVAAATEELDDAADVNNDPIAFVKQEPF